MRSLDNLYESLLRRLFSHALHGQKIGLENMHRLHDTLLPFSTIHVAGTNGKGSVATKLAKILEQSGKKTGLFTSPHLSSFRERFQINGKMISEDAVGHHLSEIFVRMDKERLSATFFEITTLLAFHYFAKENCDIAVIEVGMGGRLDATNIITPLLSIITSINYDHMQYLGSTIEKIATEKAGIIKPSVPVLVGPNAIPRSVFRRHAEAVKASYCELDGHFLHYEEENRAIVRKAVTLLPFSIPSEALEKGIEATPPCRFEMIQKEVPVILDVAHNPDGFRALVQRLDLLGRPVRSLVGFSSDKAIAECLKILQGHVQFFHAAQADNPRSASLSLLRNAFKSVHETNFTLHNSLQEAVQTALVKATKAGEILVICGSFFIMDEVRKALGVPLPCDPLWVNDFSKDRRVEATEEKELPCDKAIDAARQTIQPRKDL